MHTDSSAPLAKKLGIKSGDTILLVNRPKHYLSLFKDFPDDVTLLKGGRAEEVDFIHLFVKSTVEFEDRYQHLKPLLKKDGIMWVSWPKEKSKTSPTIHRDSIRSYILDHGLVDTKECSIDANWSGLMFVFNVVDK